MTHKCQKPRNVVPDKDDFGSQQLWLSTRTNAARFIDPSILLHLVARRWSSGRRRVIQNMIGPSGLGQVSSFHQSCVPASRAFRDPPLRPCGHTLHGWLFGISRSHRGSTDEMGAFQIRSNQEQDVNSDDTYNAAMHPDVMRFRRKLYS